MLSDVIDNRSALGIWKVAHLERGEVSLAGRGAQTQSIFLIQAGVGVHVGDKVIHLVLVVRGPVVIGDDLEEIGHSAKRRLCMV